MTRHYFFPVLSALIWSSLALAQTSTYYAKTFTINRPLEQHRGLMALGMVDAINLNKTDCFQATLGISVAGGTSFGNNLDTYFAGKNGTIAVGPGTTASTSTYDIRSSDLGLASNFIGQAAIKPSMQNMLITFDFYAAWNELIAGLYTRIRLPLLLNNTKLNRPYNVTQLGNQTYGTGFVTAYSTGDVNVVYKTVPSALCGNQTFGDAPQLTNAILAGAPHVFGLTYVHVDLGWNAILNEYYRLGISLHGVTPAAPFSAPQNFTTIYAPTVGSTHKGQLGCVVEGNLLLMHDHWQEIRLYAETMLCAVLPHAERRSLGLKLNNTVPFNHYLLLKSYSNVDNSYQGLQRAANLLYQSMQLGTNLNTDSMIMLQYTNQHWQVDIGVDFWTYSKEKSGCTNNLQPFSTQLSTNNLYFVPKAAAYVQTTANVDGGFYSSQNTTIITDGTFIPTATATTLQANQLLDSMVTVEPALVPALSATSIFGGITYWFDKCHSPFLSVGGMVEWGKKNLVLNQWLLQIKGGVSF